MSIRALLLGLDGATFTVLDPLMQRGVMPNLSAIVQRGTRAPLRTVMPVLTPPAWTSLMTGKRPGKHGVFDFFQKEAGDSEYFRFTNSQDIRTATIWSIASEHGQRVISLNFPQMFPPPDVLGCVVPGGWMPWRQLRLGCHPPGLFDRLKQLPSFNPRELALDMTLEAKAIEGCPDEEYGDWIELHTRREERWFQIVRHLMSEEPAELVGVMFDGVDKLQHLCWRFLDPAHMPERPSPWEQRMTALCERYFERLDAMIGELVALAGEQATVVLASDHGFGPTRRVFYLNAWLAQQGYLTWAAADAPQSAVEIGFGKMTRHVYELDLERTVAYAATPSSQGIHIVTAATNGTRRLSPEERAQIAAELIAALREIRDPETGEPVVSEIWSRAEAFAGPHEELAPDISVILAGGAAVSILRSDTLFRSRAQTRGSHRWEGIFVASGPRIPSGASVDELSILDVAPLLLYCLGLPIPLDVDGVVPRQALVPGALEQRPPLWSAGDAARPATAPVQAPAYGPDAQETIVNRLRALGYVE
ncbi:MAG TPA: alkaline phosphatase family protein [Solirubrobacteraceae bacterium]|nr:alkaline phosphatase family protein [Solirubrobacteraceae bacterium]